MCFAVMQSSSIVDDIVNHPRSCRTTNNELDVIARGCPCIPKMFQCPNKIGTYCVQPRKFINKNDFFRFRTSFQIILQLVNRFQPRLGMVGFWIDFSQSEVKIGQLLLKPGVFHSRQCETSILSYCLPDKECFADTSTAIDCNKFRLFTMEILL